MSNIVLIGDTLHTDDEDLKSLIQELMQRVKTLEGRVEKLTIENKKLIRENKNLTIENKKLILENKKLRDKYNHLKNISSRNSSTPPSKDPPYKPNTNKDKPNPKAASRKKKKKKKSNGGQKGHKGCRLEPVANPDKTVFHYLNFTPDGIELTEKDILRFEERQEFEIPKPSIVVTAHRATRLTKQQEISKAQTIEPLSFKLIISIKDAPKALKEEEKLQKTALEKY